MSNRIQQSAFDDVVKENMTDIDSNVDTAITDALKQFESQGMSMYSIIRDMNTYKLRLKDELNAEQHFLVSTVITLGEVIENEEPLFEIIKPALMTITKECAKNITSRCLAGQHAYNVLLKCLTICINENNQDVLSACLDAFVSFSNGQSDLLTKKGADLMISLLDDYPDDAVITGKVVKLIRLNCIKNEANRSMFYEKNMVSKLVNFLKMKNCSIVIEACAMIRVFTHEDDDRVLFSQEHQMDEKVLNELIMTLCKLSVRDDICKQVYETGILNIFIHSIHDYIDNKVLIKNSCRLLRALAGNITVKSELVTNGIATALLAVFDTHLHRADVCDVACALVATLALRNRKQSLLFVDNDIHKNVLRAMDSHPKSAKLQKTACMAVRNLVSHNRDIVPTMLAMGAEDIIDNAIMNHGSTFEAKAALKDLGCNVQLDELWPGTAGELLR